MTIDLPQTTSTSLAKLATRTWYHGTFSEIDAFWPMTHFGTREAAVLAIANHYFEGGWRGSPRLIKLSLTYNDDAELRCMEDWGGSHAIALSNAFYKLGDEHEETFAEIWNELILIKHESHWSDKEKTKEAIRRHANVRFLPLLRKIGIRGVLYQNIVEEQSGEFSICIIDVDKVNAAVREVLPIHLWELADAYESKPDHKKSIVQGSPALVNEQIAVIRAQQQSTSVNLVSWIRKFFRCK